MEGQAAKEEQRKVLLLLFPTFSEFEVSVASAVLRHSHKVMTVAPLSKPLTGEAGWQVLPHLTVDEVDPEEYEALIIPGGDMYYLRRARPLFDLVRALSQRERLLAAICSGGYVLARAGVLENRPYTVTLTPEQRSYLGCFNDRGYRDGPLVEDGHILTAQGHAYVEFALRIGERLGALYGTGTHDFYRGVRNVSMLLG